MKYKKSSSSKRIEALAMSMYGLNVETLHEHRYHFKIDGVEWKTIQAGKGRYDSDKVWRYKQGNHTAAYGARGGLELGVVSPREHQHSDDTLDDPNILPTLIKGHPHQTIESISLVPMTSFLGDVTRCFQTRETCRSTTCRSFFPLRTETFFHISWA